MNDWRRLVDDLNPGDKIEIDCGSTVAVGRYKRLVRGSNGVGAIEITRRGKIEVIPRDEIVSLSVVG